MRTAPRVPVPEKCNMAMVASNMSGHIQKQLTRSLERILEEAHLSGELKLSGRKLKDFPKVGKAKYNLQDTVIAGESSFFSPPPEIFRSLFRLPLPSLALLSRADARDARSGGSSEAARVAFRQISCFSRVFATRLTSRRTRVCRGATDCRVA